MNVPVTTSQLQGPAIRVRGLEKSYQKLRVLRGVDLDVARGSIFALLGSNGAGKTTVVKILSTLLKADAGTAHVNGFDVAAQAPDVREAISLTGQFAAVDEILTGRENQLAPYAGVTVRTVRHYHQIGLLPEPERDASGYRRYGALAAVSMIKIRTLANVGVPLSRIDELLEADAPTFTAAIRRIDRHLRDEIERLETSRRQIAQLAAGDGLTLPPEVTAYLHRLREIGASERVVAGERDGWILVAARWPDSVREFMPGKLAQLDDPRIVRLYRVLSEVFDGDVDDDPRLAEAADIMACLAEQAYAAGELNVSNESYDEMPHDLLDALAEESDPRIQRLKELLRERGWIGWNRMEPLAEPPC
ncbi:ATP-binding cassette domain-containing protein [Micromonospora andamanensis]|nr:ATP-binding cassette domain-containing protein [Micromonospora andamanensis]